MSEWKIFHLDELADIRVSNVDKKSQSGESVVRLCNYMDIYSNDYITSDLKFMEATASAAECEKFKVAQGDVMITKDSETPDDIGIPTVVLDDIDNLVCGYHLALIKPRKNVVNPIFLSKQLASADVSSYFSRMAAGSTRYGLSNGAIGRTRIPLPPLFKQNKIAVVLQTVDTAIEKTEALIEKYQQIKAGLMHDLFTRGIGADGKLRPPREQAPELYQQTPIGWIPKEWEIHKLGYALESVVDGPFGSNLKTEHYVVDPGVRVVRLQNVSEFVYNDSDKAYVSGQHASFLLRNKVVGGDVLIAGLGEERYPVGRACCYPDDIDPAINKADCFRARCNPNVMKNRFFMLVLNSEMARSQIRRYEQGVTRPRINTGNLKRLSIGVPDIDEQAQIVAKFDTAQSAIQVEQNNLEKLRQQKLGLMHDLLTGKVRVKLNEPSPEMAGG